MNLAAVMDDLAAGLETIDGLRVFGYWVDRVNPPAAIVAWPDPLSYDNTMGRGGDRTTIPIYVLAGRVDQRSARDTLARYCDGSGTHSVKQAIDGHAATAYHSARVTRADFDSITVAGVDYLAATFQVDVIGKGT